MRVWMIDFQSSQKNKKLRKEVGWGFLRKYSGISTKRIMLSSDAFLNLRNLNFLSLVSFEILFYFPIWMSRRKLPSSMLCRKWHLRKVILSSIKEIKEIVFILFLRVSSIVSSLLIRRKSIWKPIKEVKHLASFHSCITHPEQLQSREKLQANFLP